MKDELIDVPNGEEFELEGKRYKMVEDSGFGCYQCAFYHIDSLCERMACCDYQRNDELFVHAEEEIN